MVGNDGDALGTTEWNLASFTTAEYLTKRVSCLTFLLQLARQPYFVHW